MEATSYCMPDTIDYSEIRVNAAGKLECPRCKTKSYANRYNLVRHLRYECNVDGVFPCTACPKKFKHKTHLQNHLESVHGTERKFKYKSNFQKHLLNAHPTNPTERRFSCIMCPKVFKWQNNLQKHLRSAHHTDKIFPCTMCTKIFNRNMNLKRHIQNVHYMERKFPCTLCAKKFKEKVHLQRHLKGIHHINPRMIKMESK